MINNQLDSFERGHLRSRSFNELLNQYKSHIGSPNRAASDSNMILAESHHHTPNTSANSLNPSPSFMSTADISTASAATSADVSFLSRKRSFLESDLDACQMDDSPTIKRSRTAPLLAMPLSPTRGRIHNNLVRMHSPRSLRSRSLSPHKKFFDESLPVAASSTHMLHSSSTPLNEAQPEQPVVQSPAENLKKTVKLPSLSAVLGDVNSIATPSSSVSNEGPVSAPVSNAAVPVAVAVSGPAVDDSSAQIKRHITPTVSLDYFDTYKPNDENWRYELLDSINKGSKHFNLNQYNYLNKSTKPSFDSKISSKIVNPTLPSLNANTERKINFPFESNYTYLNKTYLTDVARYPEYLELAQSLVQLSQPQAIREQPVQHQEQPQLQETLTSPSLPSNIVPIAAPIASNTIPSFRQLSTTSPQMPLTNGRHSSSIICAPGPISQFSNPSLPRLPAFLLSGAPQQHAMPIAIDEPMRDASSTAIQQPVAPIMMVSAAQPPPPPPLQTLHHNPLSLPSLPTITPRTTAASSGIPGTAGANGSSTRFVPVSPPPSSSTLKKAKEALMRSPPKHHHHPRVCILCGSEQSPCWRPSWSLKEGQLCNSCGLRYKKTLARCLNDECRKIPAKGEWSLMQSKGKAMFEDGIEGYGCLECGWRVEVKK